MPGDNDEAYLLFSCDGAYFIPCISKTYSGCYFFDTCIKIPLQ